jgi:hypothetical protein
MTKILVCGDRNWTNDSLVYSALIAHAATIVIHGNARGADKLADLQARKLHLEVRAYPANWATEGRAAGILRNKRQYDLEKPDKVLAFHNHLERSKGTKHMIEYAQQDMCPVYLYKELNNTCLCCQGVTNAKTT